MSKSCRPMSSPETVTPHPLFSGIGETVTLLRMILLSLTHVGRALKGGFVERIIATVVASFLRGGLVRSIKGSDEYE